MAKATAVEKMPSEMSEKLKALEAARVQIEKQFGAGSLMKLGTVADTSSIDVIPSGSILLDEALGVGGYPRGRIIEMYGPESSGKTTLAHFLLGISNGKYMSDDCVYVQNNCIFGFCTPIPIRDYNKTITDRSDEVLDTIDDGDGVKRTLVVPPQIIASMNRIDYIVFPQYNPNCIGEIMPVKSVDLFNNLIDRKSVV